MRNDQTPSSQGRPVHQKPPLLNAPPVVIWVIIFLIAVHIIATLSGSEARGALRAALALVPEDAAAAPWTFLTYSLLHANWIHLLFNALWLLACGTPVARRIGTMRFLGLFAVTALGGAVFHLLAHGFDHIPVIGASAVIFGMLGADARFIFSTGGLPASGPPAWRENAHVRRATIARSLRDPRTLVFIFAFLGINLVFGVIDIPFLGGAIAWQAHMGGFFAGFFLFGLFDPMPRSPSGGPGNVAYGEWAGSARPDRREESGGAQDEQHH